MKASLFAGCLCLFVLSLPISVSAAPLAGQVAPKININTADVKTLTGSFQRIGKMRAEAIIKYRQTHGNFKSLAELAHVRGLSPAFINSHLAQLQAVFVTQ